MLRSRKSRREESPDLRTGELGVSREAGVHPEDDALLTDSVGLALLVVLETLAPAERVADTFAGRARAAQPALVDGAAGLVWAPGGQPRVVFRFRIAQAKIVGIELISDADSIRRIDLKILGD